MNPWIVNLLRSAGSGGGYAPPLTGRTLFAPLKSSLVLSEGTGSPTFTRATKAWRLNELGLLDEIPSGCAVFPGARFVRNYVQTKSEDFTGWSDNAGFTRPSATVLVSTNATTAHAVSQNTVAPPAVADRQYFFRYRVQYVDSRYAQLCCNGSGFGTSKFCTFDLVAGSYNATNVVAGMTAVSPGVWDIWIKATATATVTVGMGCALALVNSLTDTRLQAFVGDGVKSINPLRADFCDITGYDASYIPEYVSVGSSVNKNFLLHTDDFSQAAWSKTNITVTASAAANPINGIVNAQKIEATATAVTLLLQISSGAGSSSGNVFVIYAKKGSGATAANRFILRNQTTATNLVGITLNYDTGAIAYLAGSSGAIATDAGNGWYKIELSSSSGISTGDQMYVYTGFTGGSETAGTFCYVYRPYLGHGVTAPATIPVVGAAWDPHGSNLDGAKYYETDWQGAPIPAANLLGFKRESAATNNLLYCRDLSDAAWQQTGVSGAEILVNGSFAADTDWSKTAGWAIGSGQATCTANGSNQAISQAAGASYVSGKKYVLQYTVVSNTLNAGTLRVGGYSGSSGFGVSPTTIPHTVGSQATVITGNPTGTGVTLDLWVNGAASGALVIDNVSIKLAAVQCSKTATGLDGIANAATTLTATASDAIILQPITLSSAARCASAYVKRRTGTGTISFTQDGGSSWTDITSQINSSAYSRVQITSTLANPSVGFKIGTSGDAIDVDCVQNEAGSVATSPIVTTTATVTRNADSLTYQTASNWSDTAGTAFVEVAPLAYSGGAIGSATNGLLLSTSNSGATAYDGTNSANGPSGAPGSSEKLAFRWGSSAMTVSSGGVIGTPGTYDGGMGLSSIGVGSSAAGCFRNAAIYNYAMTDAELQAVTA